MGEVYRARDTRLQRDVAIKVLPELCATDPERLARFVREAQVLAALNHPNIAQIHGLEEHVAGGSGIHALVMELVAGEDLARRLRRGPLPLEEALQIARQIAEGLEAAHEQGIVHRDLKPANVQVRPDGTVKLLDFGIAKALEPPSATGEDAMNSPTVTGQRSSLGLIIGTAAYMAPEQAAGRAVDRRADIWAFGAVLYEMLTGSLAFPGDHATENIAAILGGEPRWDALPASTPARVRTLLRRCLTRDPKQRLQAIGDARIEIVDILAGGGPTETAARTPRSYALPIALGVVLVAAGALGSALWFGNGDPAAPETTRASLVLPPGDVLAAPPFGSQVALSPDGRTVVYAGMRDGASHLYRRAIDQLKPVQLTGTLGAGNPFFSPDGAWLAFGSGGKLKKMRLDGTGEPIVICDAAMLGGAHWNAEDTIAFGTLRGGIQRVRASGGTPEPLTTLGAEDFRHSLPEFLPGGRHLLFHIDRGTTDVVAAISLTDRKVTEILEATAARYSPGGYLVFTRPTGLWAIPFDPGSLRKTGEPVKLTEQPQTDSAGGVAHYAFGPGNMLVYLPQKSLPLERPVWAGPGKGTEPLPIEERAYSDISLAPDGERLAYSTPGESDVSEIWVRDVRRRTSILVAAERGEASSVPTWSPDGKRIAFARWQVNRLNLFVAAADGTGRAERVLDRKALSVPQFWTPDGNGLVFMEVAIDRERLNADLKMLSLKDGTDRPLLHTEHSELNAVLAPDGRYVAYQSNDSGRWEIYVRPFPDVDTARWTISPDDGEDPRWSSDGQWIFYRSSGKIVRVAVSAKGRFSAGPPQLVFDARLPVTGQAPQAYVFRRRSYDVAPDNSRVIVLQEDALAARDRAPREIVVVTNWVSQLSRQ